MARQPSTARVSQLGRTVFGITAWRRAEDDKHAYTWGGPGDYLHLSRLVIHPHERGFEILADLGALVDGPMSELAEVEKAIARLEANRAKKRLHERRTAAVQAVHAEVLGADVSQWDGKLHRTVPQIAELIRGLEHLGPRGRWLEACEGWARMVEAPENRTEHAYWAYVQGSVYFGHDTDGL
jgi:hypothetical protein